MYDYSILKFDINLRTEEAFSPLVGIRFKDNK